MKLLFGHKSFNIWMNTKYTIIYVFVDKTLEIPSKPDFEDEICHKLGIR